MVTVTSMLDPNGFLSDLEFRTLQAVCDTLVPSFEGEPDAFYRRKASDLPIAQDLVVPIAETAGPDQQRQFKRALRFIESPFFNLLLTGRPQRFSRMGPERRERVLRAWATSPIGLMRAGFQTFKRLALFLYYARPDEETGANPNWADLGYPGPVEPPAKPRRIQPLSIGEDTALDADVAVVGSGAGGAVVAAELAAAGHDVIVLEKGGYFGDAEFDGQEMKGFRDLFEKMGILATRDVGVAVFAGSNLGGGTTVGWTTSLPTPGHVLEEWHRDYGLSWVTGPEWDASLQAVWDRLDVNVRESQPNRQNQALIDGCEALGYRWRVVPRNVRGCQDCGYCGFGCRFGAKQGTLVTYLRDAHDRGASIVVGCHVDRVKVEGGTAVGVETTVNGHRLTVGSKAVVAAAGSVHTPALMLRSGLTNTNIGRHLRLHPVAAAFGIYDEPIESWRGHTQTAACNEFEDLDDGYGFLVEVVPAHPGLWGLGIPWSGGRSHKELTRQSAHMAVFIALCRDRGSGRVQLDGRGQPALDYPVSKYDAGHLIRGAQEALRLQAAAGAHTVGGPYNNREPCHIRQGDDFDSYLRWIERRGVVRNDFGLYSAHQMSSCRMGSDRGRAAVNPEGETYDVKNLFVADGSALPSAPGVNPMITIMAVAHRTAQAIKSRL
ncbi:MAG: GMC family oxidoreductase N-terminal domain-containing protein [Anaerolineae bacterium]